MMMARMTVPGMAPRSMPVSMVVMVVTVVVVMVVIIVIMIVTVIVVRMGHPASRRSRLEGTSSPLSARQPHM